MIKEHNSQERLQMSLGYFPEVKLNEYQEYLENKKGLKKRDHFLEKTFKMNKVIEEEERITKEN